MKATTLSMLTVVVVTPALAQTNGTYLLTSTNTVSPSSPTTTIEVWSTWGNPTWGVFTFALGDYDLTASDGEFSNAVNVLNGPGSSTGVIAGNVISGAINGQIIIAAVPPVPPRNPILLATYDWTTTDFTSRAVDLHTSNTSRFVVYHPIPLTIVELYPHEFTPGSGVINVVPAPAAWLALALPLAAATRRRRS